MKKSFFYNSNDRKKSGLKPVMIDNFVSYYFPIMPQSAIIFTPHNMAIFMLV
jgi:hypothetical protein